MPNKADMEAVRRLYSALSRANLDEIEVYFHQDATWHIPGKNQLSGTHRGWSAIRNSVFARQQEISRATFRAGLLDLTVGDVYIVAVVHATADRNGRRLDQTVCQLMLVENAKIREIRGHYADQAQLDAFWG